MLESTITSKGQTTLPRQIRDHLGLGPGDRVRYLIVDGDVRLVRPRKAMTLAGALAHDGPPVTLDEMDAAVRTVATGAKS